MAATSGFLLGLDYSEWADPTSSQIATDALGNLYILSLCTNSDLSCVGKVSGDGKAILWQNALEFTAAAMAVDPRGGVYVTPFVTGAQPLRLIPVSCANLLFDRADRRFRFPGCANHEGAGIYRKTGANTAINYRGPLGCNMAAPRFCST